MATRRSVKKAVKKTAKKVAKKSAKKAVQTTTPKQVAITGPSVPDAKHQDVVHTAEDIVQMAKDLGLSADDSQKSPGSIGHSGPIHVVMDGPDTVIIKHGAGKGSLSGAQANEGPESYGGCESSGPIHLQDGSPESYGGCESSGPIHLQDGSPESYGGCESSGPIHPLVGEEGEEDTVVIHIRHGKKLMVHVGADAQKVADHFTQRFHQ